MDYTKVSRHLQYPMIPLTPLSGAWLVLPSYMIYLTGSEILQGLTIVAGGADKSSDDTALIKTD